MGTTLRAELSEKNPYWIEKHRYYELKHFCLQYPIWKKAYAALDGTNTKTMNLAMRVITNNIDDPTSRYAIARAYYADRMNMLERVARVRLTDVTIPTVGEMFDWDDEWDRNHFEADNDKQLPLMKQRRNRVAYYDNECEFGWLRNATKKEFSSACFAFVNVRGITGFNNASDSLGVRPEIWLVK